VTRWVSYSTVQKVLLLQPQSNVNIAERREGHWGTFVVSPIPRFKICSTSERPINQETELQNVESPNAENAKIKLPVNHVAKDR
jgi:hypothetical protein